MRNIHRTLAMVSLLAFTPLYFAPTAHAADEEAGSAYQIVKATKDRVWRLNKRTGEIAVCSINGENLMCTTSTDAIKPPAKTYAELETERKQATVDARERREDDRKRDLDFVNKMIDALKEVVRVASEREAITPTP